LRKEARGVKRRADRFDRAVGVFEKSDGMLRYSDAVRIGVHPDTLAGLLARKRLERVARGFYRLADLPPLSSPDLATVAARVPEGVVCLISALSFHDMTTQIPHEVHLAVAREARPPRIDYPPVRVYRFSDAAFKAGVEEHKIDGFVVRVYDPEKTLADCFKFRNRIGLDVAVEALRLYRERSKLRVKKILEYARACRVERVMAPYLDATL
jgi:predicted transcriptional regulator of viral defense system